MARGLLSVSELKIVTEVDPPDRGVVNNLFRGSLGEDSTPGQDVGVIA